MNCRVITYTSGLVPTLVVDASRGVVIVMAPLIVLMVLMNVTATALVMSLSTSNVATELVWMLVFAVTPNMTVLTVQMNSVVHVMSTLNTHVEMAHVSAVKESVMEDLIVETEVMSLQNATVISTLVISVVMESV